MPMLSASIKSATQPVESVRRCVAGAALAQQAWQQTSVKNRVRTVRAFRHEIVDHTQQLVQAVTFPGRNGAAETLAGEIIPLAEACRFLERRSVRLLASRKLSRRDRPFWLQGVDVEVHREPVGVVLIVGAANYPLFLTGVQALQAIVAGNAVLLKPGRGATSASYELQCFWGRAGLDKRLFQVLPEENETVDQVIQVGVDKVVLTGSANAGRSVLSSLATSLTPAAMELSGCDAVFVLESADLSRVARCLSFGLNFNSSATCIAPRRVFVLRHQQDKLIEQLRSVLAHSPLRQHHHARHVALVRAAVAAGARCVAGELSAKEDEFMLTPLVLADAKCDLDLLREDVFGPIVSLVPVESMEEALVLDRRCTFALGATVFGEPNAACEFAHLVDAGCVITNDMIAPTADPRVAFGGRHQSGFGVTRGAEGLIEMTQIKTIIQQRSRWLPHLQETSPTDAALLTNLLQMLHGRNWRGRLRAARATMRSAVEQQKWKQGILKKRSQEHVG